MVSGDEHPRAAHVPSGLLRVMWLFRIQNSDSLNIETISLYLPAVFRIFHSPPPPTNSPSHPDLMRDARYFQGRIKKE